MSWYPPAQPLPLKPTRSNGSNQSQWTLLAAAVVIASLPLVALFAAAQRQLIRASVAGALRG